MLHCVHQLVFSIVFVLAAEYVVDRGAHKHVKKLLLQQGAEIVSLKTKTIIS